MIFLSALRNQRLPQNLLIFLVVIFCFWTGRSIYATSSSSSSSSSFSSSSRPFAPVLSSKSPRVYKVSMLYGETNHLYERALQSHERHGSKWGYPLDVLRQDISVGFWNKPSYLMALVIRELAKPPGERVEWLMYVLFHET
jgi:hypothetical protein